MGRAEASSGQIARLIQRRHPLLLQRGLCLRGDAAHRGAHTRLLLVHFFARAYIDLVAAVEQVHDRAKHGHRQYQHHPRDLIGRLVAAADDLQHRNGGDGHIDKIKQSGIAGKPDDGHRQNKELEGNAHAHKECAMEDDLRNTAEDALFSPAHTGLGPIPGQTRTGSQPFCCHRFTHLTTTFSSPSTSRASRTSEVWIRPGSPYLF